MERYYCTIKRGQVTTPSDTTIVWDDERVKNFFEPTPDGYIKAYTIDGLPFNELIPVPTQTEIDANALAVTQSEFRTDRDALLKDADIQIFKLEDNGLDSMTWRAYRQSLRDATIDWTMPIKPA
jgi:hypothetical protein